MLLFIGAVQYPIATFISFMLAITIAFAYHEFAHAIVADRLGDLTPRRNGRITLNPLPHLSAMGLLLVALFGFGWASTPINPYALRGRRYTSHALVAAAGPAANLIMAVLFALPILVGLVSDTPPISTVIPSPYSFLAMAAWTNLFLCFFNLIPIPPLDGFTVLLGILPAEMAYQLEPLYRYGFYVLLFIFLVLPRLNIDLIGKLVFEPAFFIFGVLTGFRGSIYF